MNILKSLFKKKEEKKGSLLYAIPQIFLEKKLVPIAKYLYNGKVLVSDAPIIKENKVCFVIYFVGKDSKKLGEFYISVDDTFEWMGIIKNEEEN